MPEAPYAARLARLGAALADHEVDALLVTAPTNVRYLTGYAGTNGAIVVRGDGATFLTDSRYAVRTRAYEAYVEVAIVDRDLIGTLARRLGELAPGADRVGFETTLAWGHHHRVAEEAAPIELIPIDRVVEGLRAVKSPEELAAIRVVMDHLETVYAMVAERGLVGRTEREVAWAIEQGIREAGFPSLSFPSIVAAGPNGGSPHAEPQDDAIERGTLVVVDIGVRGDDGYCSDCTRTFAAGGSPPAAAVEDYALVRAAQQAGLDAVRPGVSGVDADAAARAVIDAGGAGELFGHGLGHGIGLDIHEAPTLSPSSSDTLAAGNVCSVEPGVYRPGAWGVRIEDAVVVTEAGCEILTGFSRDLIQTG